MTCLTSQPPRCSSHPASVALLGLVLSTLGVGCAQIRAVPVNHLPPAALARSKDTLIDLSLSRLAQQEPEFYALDSGDTLGIYIETILGAEDEAPPVHFPEDASQQPALGFPVPVDEDGYIALPLIERIYVRGASLQQARELIKKAHVEEELVPEGKERVLVTLMKKRAIKVLVVREEGDTASNRDDDEGSGAGEGFTIELPAYENDLMHALAATGGLPGNDAQNEILIYRGGAIGSAERDALIASLNNGISPDGCRIPLPEDPAVTKIPIRFYPEQLPRFTEQDIILNEGDIVHVQARDREKFYTAGLLGGGEFLLPKNYDLDVMQAIAIAGGSIGGSSGISSIGGRGGAGFGNGGGAGGLPPSRAIVLRKLPECGTEVPIEVNLKHALTDPSQRLIIQPDDTIIIRYTFCEEVGNIALNLFQFNYFVNGRN